MHRVIVQTKIPNHLSKLYEKSDLVYTTILKLVYKIHDESLLDVNFQDCEETGATTLTLETIIITKSEFKEIVSIIDVLKKLCDSNEKATYKINELISKLS
jgi:hypothetical protein